MLRNSCKLGVVWLLDKTEIDYEKQQAAIFTKRPVVTLWQFFGEEAKMDYQNRIHGFKSTLNGKADFAFFPISADLQYLTGIHREMPTFGAIRHPGGWLEGMWLTPSSSS